MGDFSRTGRKTGESHAFGGWHRWHFPSRGQGERRGSLTDRDSGLILGDFSNCQVGAIFFIGFVS